MQLSELEIKFNSAKDKATSVEVTDTVIPLANAFQGARKYDAAVRSLNEALAIIRECGEVEREAVILTALGTAFWEKAQLQKALDHFSQALHLFKESSDRMGEKVILTMVGVTFWRKCEWQRALIIFSDLWSETSRLMVDDRFITVKGALERGVSTLQNRVRMGRDHHDSLKILQPLFSICVLYRILGDGAQFDVCFDEAVVLAESLNKTDIVNAAKSLSRLVK
jgi:tetratricopeptide (TPR) repeat protein